MKKVLIGLLALVFVSVIGVLGYIIYSDIAKPNNVGQALPVSASPSSSGSSTSSQASVKINDMKPVETTSDILSALDHEKTQNKDTVGWINIPDTKISNSVLQADNNAYYLNINERGEQDIFGAYFADYTCNFGTREELSANTVIYGHSDVSQSEDQPDGRRFSQLFKYEDQDFARRHPLIYFSTPYESMKWQIFAVFYTDLDLDFTRADPSGTALVQLANDAKARSIYNYGVEVGQDDKILTLVTCTVKYGKEDQEKVRYVVMAKLLDDGESPVSISQLEENPNPIQPDLTK
jgi:SrtB family sortase